MQTAIPSVGSTIGFSYPRHNYLMAQPRLEPRRLRVDRIRDMAAEPTDILTIAVDPMLRRGRTLITGLDLDKGLERSFYLESMEDIEPIDPKTLADELPPLRVAIEDIEIEDVHGEDSGVEIKELDDPRGIYCRAFNDMCDSAVAYPISRAMRVAS